MQPDTPVAQYLHQHRIPYRIFVHPGPVRSLEQAARKRAQLPEQVTRSILFRLSENKFVMLLISDPRLVSWKALRRYHGQSRLTMTSDAERLAVTGYRRGAVEPFGLSSPLRNLVDASLRPQVEVSTGCSVHGTAIILSTSDLLRALPAVEIADFGEK
ncbi:MAG TPA: YbaK/EbsC family protein [Levilinea sp.]|nr:YbaK/EbsC family protein [Levilinea sp.]